MDLIDKHPCIFPKFLPIFKNFHKFSRLFFPKFSQNGVMGGIGTHFRGVIVTPVLWPSWVLLPPFFQSDLKDFLDIFESIRMLLPFFYQKKNSEIFRNYSGPTSGRPFFCTPFLPGFWSCEETQKGRPRISEEKMSNISEKFMSFLFRSFFYKREKYLLWLIFALKARFCTNFDVFFRCKKGPPLYNKPVFCYRF